MDNILGTVKESVGITFDYVAFDGELLTLVNSVLYTLYQIGVGDKPLIANSDSVWSDLCADVGVIEACKPYVSFKVKLLFDPPSNTAYIENYISELETRIRYAVDKFDDDDLVLSNL